MKQTTFTVTAETVFLITRAESDGPAGSAGAIAELHNLDEAIATAKALVAATPGAMLDIKVGVEILTFEGRQAVLQAAVRAAEGAAIRNCLSAGTAARSVVEASIEAAETIALTSRNSCS